MHYISTPSPLVHTFEVGDFKHISTSFTGSWREGREGRSKEMSHGMIYCMTNMKKGKQSA